MIYSKRNLFIPVKLSKWRNPSLVKGTLTFLGEGPLRSTTWNWVIALRPECWSPLLVPQSSPEREQGLHPPLWFCDHGVFTRRRVSFPNHSHPTCFCLCAGFLPAQHPTENSVSPLHKEWTMCNTPNKPQPLPILSS